jgi:hypothetical protein
MARKPKPRKTPEEREAERILARARDLDAVNLQPDVAALLSGADIEVTRAGQKREGQKVTSDSARRLDAFAALKDGMAVGAYDAARRLEADILARMGIYDRSGAVQRVDKSAGITTDTMRAAGIMVDRVLGRLSARDGNLLHELINPPLCRGTWRDHVRYMTGEVNAVAQGAVVRMVCVNLRDAYAEIERRVAA